MIIKKLPIEIQSLFNASIKINNYKDAIEELVYNSLDANATSVAIRIHIYENLIQVIDNGFGIAKYDIPLLGKRYASSKVTDASSLKSAPIKYGFRGASLSNIIEVSQCVKITTRHKDTEETWVKSFYKGQHKDSQITSMRPSKGTTVEVKGFLYNMNIQRKVTNPLNELQNIKLFLQQTSLINTNVSISFRDNSRNEIVFKVHKNRDVYQTLSSIYEIKKKDLQELQIEKHQYKAKGFIGKQNSDPNSYRWIYLNGRFIHKCTLHDIINSNFSKNKQQGRNVKIRNNFHDFEKKILSNANLIPTYFIFIKCPHLDYDINITPAKTIIEFKNWSQIKLLLEKLVQVYKGDIKLKKIDVDQTERKNKIENTREEVRKIMEKVLGTKTKNHRISQLHKSVKGKIMKKKKNTKSSNRQWLKNMHRIGKENTDLSLVTYNLGVPMENPSLVIKETPVSINCQVDKDINIELDPHIENDSGIVNRPLKSKKDKRNNKSKLTIELIVQQNKKEKKTVNTHDTDNTDRAGNYGNHKEISVIEKTPLSNHSQVAQDVNTEKRFAKKQLIKTKPLKSKNEKRKIKAKQNIDPIIKQYLKENAIKLYCENLKNNIGKKVNRAQDKNPHKSNIKADKVVLENRGNISSFHDHKTFSFTACGVTHLKHVEKEYLQSSDLLKTVLNSQKEYNFLNEKNTFKIQNSPKLFGKEYNYYGKDTVRPQKIHRPPENENKCDVVNNTNHRQCIHKSFEHNNNCNIQKHTNHIQNMRKFSSKKYSHIGKDMAHIQNRYEPSIILNQYDRHNKRITYSSNKESNISTTHVYKSFPKLTFESHKYNVDDIFSMKNNRKLKRFISEQSKENFSLHNNIEHTFNITNKCKSYYNKHSNIGNKRQYLHYNHPYIKPIKNVPYFEHKSSHTIEFSTTNNNMYNANKSTTWDQWNYKITGNVQNTYTILDSNVSLDIANYMNNINNSTAYHQETLASYLRFNLSSVNVLNEKGSYEVPTVMQNMAVKEINISNSEMLGTQKTNDLIEPIDLCEAVYHNNSEHHHYKSNHFNTSREKIFKDNVNYLAASNKTGDVYENDILSCQNNNVDVTSRYFKIIENSPNLSLNSYHHLTCRNKNTRNRLEKNQNVNFCNDVLNNISLDVNGGDNFNRVFNEEVEKSHQFQTKEESQPTLQVNEFKDLSAEEGKERKNDDENQTNSDLVLSLNITRIDAEEKSSHIHTNNQNMHLDKCINSLSKQHSKDNETRNCTKDNQIKPNNFEIVEECCEIIQNFNNENRKMSDNFKLRNRHSFVPKGMSPIFENCNNKNICSYNLETDYFQDDLYNNFANDVLGNIKIFENKVIDISEKINKDHKCLKFDAQSLKNAKIFGQVDRKFIVAELQSDNFNMKHLVLFDQHAVHERIKLEKNLSDYKDGDQWNSMSCESLSLTLSKDTVLYLNNFRDKFKQFGLEWKIENDCLITINAIPKAIFGKHCRQADVIIQSIKNLILEEIKAMKSLGGNTLLYPKSIMDLVFSEACRYAIKFGDKLSKGECASLISSLSSCQTPFQCAHGRPVLAVLSDLRTYDNDYKVDASKILSFRNKLI